MSDWARFRSGFCSSIQPDFLSMHLLDCAVCARVSRIRSLWMGTGESAGQRRTSLIALGGIIFIAKCFKEPQNVPWQETIRGWKHARMGGASPPALTTSRTCRWSTSRQPLWTPHRAIVVTGLRDDRREVLVTTLMDGAPHHRYPLPGSTMWPFLTAVGFGIGLWVRYLPFRGITSQRRWG